jgi:predicted ATPase/class 3 adenylate cyclase
MSEREQLENAIQALEGQRSLLGDAVVDAALEPMRQKLAVLTKKQAAAPSSKGQERKQVTVLFADVSGFTAMSELLDPEEVTGFMNTLWMRLDKAIIESGGYIDKHIGDAIMALFGTPVAQEDDPVRAVRAALQMQVEIKNWKSELAASKQDSKASIPNIQMRIGIHTGGVLLGTVGTTGEYTAMGDTVNLASRLEHAAPVAGILISHDTYRHVRGLFDLTQLEPIKVKGKVEPVNVYVVNSAKPYSFRVTTRGVEGIETRTIGREKELEKLRSALNSVETLRQIYLTSVVAEAGTGKSRLLYEFITWLDVQALKVRVFKGRATKEIQQRPYGLIRDLFTSLFELQESDRAAVVREKFEHGVVAVFDNAPEAVRTAHFIGHLTGFDFSKSTHLQGSLQDARQFRDDAFYYTAQFFNHVAQDRTVVILLEDLHWADDGSLDLLEYLMHNLQESPVLIIGLSRPAFFERRPDWGKDLPHHLRLDLTPLSEQDGRNLVQEILRKVPEIPASLMDLIVARAEGSPFYIEELIKVLIDDGVILRGEAEWQVNTQRLVNLKVPTTLVGVLQARLDSLSTREREILQQAAIVGRVFWGDLLEHMHNPDIEESCADAIIRENLTWLNQKELIFKREDSAFAGTPEFIFKHAILHDVTYESVLLRLRRVYHMQVAEGLIQLSNERAEEYAGRIGEHYEHAGEWIRAAEWYLRAGKQAQDTYVPESAITYYQRALTFLQEHAGPDHFPQQLDLCQHLGEVLNWQARYADATEIYRTMLEVAESAGDLVSQSHALQGLATSQGYAGDHSATLEYAVRAEAIAHRANASIELAGALWMQGAAFYRKGEVQKTLALAEQALAITSELNNLNEMARSLNLLGAAHYLLDNYTQAEEDWGKALSICQEIGNRRLVMDMLSNLGVIADARGDYETAFQRYDQALAIARELRNRDGEIVFLSNLGGEQTALKNFKAAEDDLRQAIHLAGEEGSWVLANTYYYLAEACLGQDKLQEAYAAALKSLSLGQEEEVLEHIGAAWRVLGLIAIRTEKPVQVVDRKTGLSSDFDPGACFFESNRIFSEIGVDGDRALTLREWGRYEMKIGRTDVGENKLQEALEIFEKLGAVLEVERMKTYSAE